MSRTYLEKSLSELRTIRIEQGPSEMQILEASFFRVSDMKKKISFAEKKHVGLGVSCQIVALVPLSTPGQYHMLVTHVALAMRFYHVICFDTVRRLGSYTPCTYAQGFELLSELGTERCPFETSSRFDDIVLKVLANSSPLPYTELRKATRIKRGLPEILLGLERSGKIRCRREGDIITTVVLV